MRQRLPMVLVVICFAAMFFACYTPVLFQDHQFGFRDAAHYYYPLYQRVQTEWESGRWPLWEPEENAGMPLLGNPTAAVLYPGKLIYAVLPYAWAARAYIIIHSSLAFAAMLILMRSWQVSWAGSGLSAMAYAFGVPVLFQTCNVIYLVGAAWLPLGFHAVDRWVRLGRRWGLIELTLVLAMQTLGGDPQVSYLLGLAGIGYAAGLARGRRARERSEPAASGDAPSAGSWGWLWLVAAVLAVVSWVVVTLMMGQWLPRIRPKGYPPPALPWMRYVPLLVATAWTAAGAVFLLSWRRRGWRMPLGTTWLGLALSALLALAVTAAQLLPVLEFTQLTSRAAIAGPHDIYPFSIDLPRLATLFWPNALGIQFNENTYWGDLLRLPGTAPKTWVPSLYLGCLVLVLAMGALSTRRGTPWRIWLTVIVVVSLVGSLGRYTSPIWVARVLGDSHQPPERPGVTTDVISSRVNSQRPNELKSNLKSKSELKSSTGVLAAWAPDVGPLDSEDSTPIRLDRYLRDGDGGIYWWLSTLLPGFRQFRFPAKLFTFTALALAALAGLGWDGLRAGETRRTTALAAMLLALSLAVLAGVWMERSSILGAFRAFEGSSIYGPFDPAGAYAAIVRGLTQTAIVLAAGLAAVRLAGPRPLLAGGLALIVTTGDLVAANSPYVLTIPQALFETTSPVARIIEDAERAQPSPGPFRVHRMPIWDPLCWMKSRSSRRNNELVVWERETLQPKYGINMGIEYVETMGVAELYDYEWYFGGFPRIIRTGEMSRLLNVAIGKEVVYFPRRAFDMWNARYFVLPVFPNGWRDEHRGFASFLLDTEPIYPDPNLFRGPTGRQAVEDWVDQHDFQVLRNRREHPRAWIVHEARVIEPSTELSREERKRAMEEIVYADDPLWHDPTLQAFDPLRLVWVARDQHAALAAYLQGGPPRRSETVHVRYPSPQRVEIEATLDRPGVVVLADVYYPGWTLTIDGKPTPVYPVNRLMRGAAVPKGTSHLVYTYAPQSFRIGRVVSLSALGMLALLTVVCALRPVEPLIASQLRSPLNAPTPHD